MDSKLSGNQKDFLKEAVALFRILAYLKNRKAKQRIQREDVAKQAGYSTRQTQRYINLLKNSELIEFDRTEGTYCLTDSGRQFPQISLEVEEALALFLAAAIAPRQELPYAQQLTTAVAKVSAGLPVSLRSVAQEVQEQLGRNRAAPQSQTDVLAHLLEACRLQKVIRFDYSSEKSGRRWRDLHPYGLDIDATRWYVHGWCPENQQIRTFKLVTVHTVEVTPQVFERDEAAWSEFKGAGGVFRQWRGEPVWLEAVFTPTVAAYARRTAWPDGLTLAELPDGSVTLTGYAQGIEGVVPELLRWRRHVTVLGGAELLEAYRAELHAMSALYE